MARQGLKNVSTAVMICMFLYEPFLCECMKDTELGQHDHCVRGHMSHVCPTWF